jgi:hypothetical protein
MKSTHNILALAVGKANKQTNKQTSMLAEENNTFLPL